MKALYWTLAKAIWQWRKKLAMQRKKPVPPFPGAHSPSSPHYIDPEEYGCKPGVLTWEYLNALYYQTFPEMRENEGSLK